MGAHSHTQVSLELGGKGPDIVFESADLEQGGFPDRSLQNLTIDVP